MTSEPRQSTSQTKSPFTDLCIKYEVATVSSSLLAPDIGFHPYRRGFTAFLTGCKNKAKCSKKLVINGGLCRKSFGANGLRLWGFAFTCRRKVFTNGNLVTVLQSRVNSTPDSHYETAQNALRARSSLPVVSSFADPLVSYK